MLTKNKKAVKKQEKPTKRNYNAKLKLDMSFEEVLERSVEKK